VCGIVRANKQSPLVGANDYSPLRVNEIFYSIQGESSYAGKPCIFIRLAGCNLRCSYCDTEYAFYEGINIPITEIIKKVGAYDCKLVEITGGEPLLQENVYHLMTILCNKNYRVMLETGGQMDISRVDNRIKIVMDIKCPSSGEMEKNIWQNVSFLKKNDEIKFVIREKKDFDWAVDIMVQYKLNKKCPVVFSPVYNKLDNKLLADWILSSHIDVRMQLQLHKYIWGADKRGV
jgi:7-carboxy-7-deazaguanine synthase